MAAVHVFAVTSFSHALLYYSDKWLPALSALEAHSLIAVRSRKTSRGIGVGMSIAPCACLKKQEEEKQHGEHTWDTDRLADRGRVLARELHAQALLRNGP
jgi:hypothetical protein